MAKKRKSMKKPDKAKGGPPKRIKSKGEVQRAKVLRKRKKKK